ncbi:MAG: hypothetical protein QGI21_03710 [Candidatus Poseidoniaceae archaeon]|nr:hypothetical protein [Candidatus Poseidoniaceae archaeon]
MAEAIITTAFLISLGMILSLLFTNGRLLPGIVALLLLIKILTSPLDSIHQEAGVSIYLCFAITCGGALRNHSNPESWKKVNGWSGLITSLILIVHYPKEGIVEMVQVYSIQQSILQIASNLLVGVVLILTLTGYGSEKEWAPSLASILMIPITFESPILYSALLLPTLWLFEGKIDSKLGVGDRRSIAMGLTILIGISIMFLLTKVLVSTVPRIGDGYGADAVSLWLTLGISVTGLIGMMLPQFGFDWMARPESWGWRNGLAIGPMLLTLQTDLAIVAMPGVWLAILVSITGPLVLEKKPAKRV